MLLLQDNELAHGDCGVCHHLQGGGSELQVRHNQDLNTVFHSLEAVNRDVINAILYHH